MNKHVLYYFRDEIEKKAFLASSLTGAGLFGARAGLGGMKMSQSAMKAFNPLTKTKNMTSSQKLLSKSVPGSPFSKQRIAALTAARKANKASTAVTAGSNKLIQSSVKNQNLLNQIGDAGLELLM